MLSNIFAGFPFLLSFVLIYSTVAEFNLNHLHTPLLQTRNFEAAIENKALNSSFVFLTVNVSNEEKCMFKCLMYQDCFSYNLAPKEGELMVCEVCSHVRTGLSHLVTKTGYKHRKVVNSCSNSPCPALDICVPDVQTTSSYQCWNPYIDLELKTYGNSDPLGPNGEVSLDSYFKVNGHKYPLTNGYRGHNFRLVTFKRTAIVGPQVNFDSYGDTAAGSKMASYISTIPVNSIVLVVVADSGNHYYNGNALMSIGATSPAVGYRNAWAFIGFKGERKPAWIVEKKTAEYAGPASVTARIPFNDFV